MRRYSWLFLVAFALLACRALSPTAAPTLTPFSTAEIISQPTGTAETPSPTPRPSPTAPSEASPAPTQPPSATPAAGFMVRLHPEGGLYVGDRASMEVIPPAGMDVEDRRVQVQVDAPSGPELRPQEFGPYGIGDRIQATFLWAWDTAGMEAGEHSLTFTVQPGGPTWTETVTLRPRSELPPPEPEAHWEKAESENTVQYYITGTEAERDLEMLLKIADEQAADAAEKLHTELKEPIPIVWLPRVLGHGGFTGNEIAVSYLGRNYAGSSPALVLHHEMIHLLDGRLGGELRPTMLVEGLAVYLSGGHFKPEPLLPRAAALLPPAAGCPPPPPAQTLWSKPGPADWSFQAAWAAEEACSLGWYLPLAPLADDFYVSQHEIGYLEAGALVEYMVESWGWEQFSAFYRDIHPVEGAGQAQAIDAALREHYHLSLSGLEAGFLSALREESLTPELVEDVQVTVTFYDTVRRYQRELDPSAYFLTAWLPNPGQMREQGIVADYLRHPGAPENLGLETLLVGADAALRGGDFAEADRLLAMVNAALDTMNHNGVIGAQVP